MKKLLIIAYDFPPYVSVGALRPYSWYKYLKEFNIEPIVITRQWGNEYKNSLDYIAPGENKELIVEESGKGTILRTPYKPTISNRILLKYGENKFRLFRKAFTAFDETRQYFYVSGSKKQLYFTADEYLKKNKVDAIIATGEPFVLFFYANKLSKKYKIPWIADYRDPWSQNKGRHRNLFEKKLNIFAEKKILKSVNSITTVSDFFKKQIETLAPIVPYHILTNGYDPETIDKIKNIEQRNDKLQFSFVGTIYEWHPWKSFLTAFNSYLKSRDDAKAGIEIQFYGINNSEEIEAFIETELPDIKKNVIFNPKMDNQKLLPIIKISNAFLLFNDYSILGTKIFDYLGLKRKIILCYENDAEAEELKRKHYTLDEFPGLSKRLQAEVIEKTNSGIVIQDQKHLISIFDCLWNEFKKNKRIECASEGYEDFSRKAIVQKLSEIIHGI